MANYQNLKAAISAAIRTNGNQEITGQVLQDVLNSIVSVIGANYTFAGVATPATNPGTPDQNVIYLAMEGGTYTNFNGTVLPAGISLLMWNGSWTSETVMYGDGGVFDISVYKSSGGTLATFADLAAALDGGNNIPAAARKGGMSVKFVQTSDNKYVQCRCMAQNFTTDTTQWAIAEEGVYVDNPEFVRVVTDKDDKILLAIKSDGTVYFGAGVPPQIVEYIQIKIDEYHGDDIIDFLSNFLGSDQTLKEYLDDIYGKYIENSEWIKVLTDAQDKVIAGVRKDGSVYINKIEGVTEEIEEIQEALGVLESKIEDIPVSYKIGEPDTTVHFQIQVNVNLDNTTDVTINPQDSQTLETDESVLMLPHNYTRNGKPVPLFLCCHGAAGYDGSSDKGAVTSEDSQVERSVTCKYMCANGYAVLDTNGLPEQFSIDNGIKLCQNMGSPIAIQCYIKAYRYVVENYNIRTDGVVLFGGSMGGLTSANLVMTGAIPVRVQVNYCPCTDTYNQAWLHPWYADTKKALKVFYGFTSVENYDETKMRGCNPVIDKMQSFDSSGARVSSVGTYDYSTGDLNNETVTEYKDYPVVLKIWHCEDDPSVAFGGSVRQVTAIKNAGGMAYLRAFPTGGHFPEEAGSTISNPVGNTNFRGTRIYIKPAVEELFLFVKRYVDNL